jgi:N-glycosylase/DNA lyase
MPVAVNLLRVVLVREFQVRGLRLLRQPPVECLFAFICSANNNIGRITSMLHSLRRLCGPLVAEVDGVKYHGFPTVDALAGLEESTLRDLAFG